MAKSKRNLGYNLVGLLDKETMIVTEYDKNGEIVGEHNLEDILSQFHGREVTIAVKESSEL
jgi:hypothetical protein